MKSYKYIGPAELLKLVKNTATRCLVNSKFDILEWVQRTQKLHDNIFTVTFVIALDGKLWIADRHSEHIACAQGYAVFSAGEMTFQLEQNEIKVVEVTNQSTGYCPEPESWICVAMALDNLKIKHPGDFTTWFNFRKCIHCHTINVVKDDYWFCAVCDTELDECWNFNSVSE